MKICYMDLETTGIQDEAAVVQIAGIIEINGEIKESFNIKCKPHYGAVVDPKALDVIGKTIEQLDEEQHPLKAFKELEGIFSRYVNKFDKKDKFIMVAHNHTFDFRMIMNFFKKCGSNYLGAWLDYKLNFCTLYTIKALQVVGKLPVLSNNKLETWCEHFGIELNNAHDALADITATRSLYKKIVEVLK